MNHNPQSDKLVSRLAAIYGGVPEWDAALPGLGESYKRVFENIRRHGDVGSQLIQRAQNGKDCDAQIAELRATFAAYDPLLRALSLQCLRLAEISKQMHAKLEHLNTP